MASLEALYAIIPLLPKPLAKNSEMELFISRFTPRIVQMTLDICEPIRVCAVQLLCLMFRCDISRYSTSSA